MTRIWTLAAILALVVPSTVAVPAALFGPLVVCGAYVTVDIWARHLGWVSGPRPGGKLVWRWWWWYGYRGLYQFDWMMKRRAALKP